MLRHGLALRRGSRGLAVGADRPGVVGLERAEQAGVPTFVLRTKETLVREAHTGGADVAVPVTSD